MVTSAKRSVQIKVTLTKEMHAQLSQVAQQFGQAPATLCSVWIGQMVAQQARNLGAAARMEEAMVKEAGFQLTEQLKLVAAAEGKS
jgi:transposase-like protein